MNQDRGVCGIWDTDFKKPRFYGLLRCDRYGRAAAGRRRDGMSKVGSSDSKNTLYCSFCGKSQHEVRKLIAGPTVFICDECVELCMDIIREENKSSLVKSRDGIPTPK